MIILKLISSKDSEYIYQDTLQRQITIEMTDVSWTFKVHSASPELMKYQHRIVDVFVNQGTKQHDYKGGFSEAISILLIPESNL